VLKYSNADLLIELWSNQDQKSTGVAIDVIKLELLVAADTANHKTLHI